MSEATVTIRELAAALNRKPEQSSRGRPPIAAGSPESGQHDRPGARWLAVTDSA